MVTQVQLMIFKGAVEVGGKEILKTALVTNLVFL